MPEHFPGVRQYTDDSQSHCPPGAQGRAGSGQSFAEGLNTGRHEKAPVHCPGTRANYCCCHATRQPDHVAMVMVNTITDVLHPLLVQLKESTPLFSYSPQCPISKAVLLIMVSRKQCCKMSAGVISAIMSSQ